ncbi:MAG: DUF4333 domain-containing protein [Pseudonocardiales bacterium]|nr:MAG: DUF4333 domain-containing protein [Pseudonocardiales bacterium]
MVSVTVLAACALTSCSASISSGKKVAKAEVEKLSSDQLAAKTGQAPKSVTCPGDLKAKVGTVMRCSLATSDGRKFGFAVTVTSVKDNVAHFDIKVDDKPTP